MKNSLLISEYRGQVCEGRIQFYKIYEDGGGGRKKIIKKGKKGKNMCEREGRNYIDEK
jgi:hypothetical protein